MGMPKAAGIRQCAGSTGFCRDKSILVDLIRFSHHDENSGPRHGIPAQGFHGFMREQFINFS
jgi:hypothetical protein